MLDPPPDRRWKRRDRVASLSMEGTHTMPRRIRGCTLVVLALALQVAYADQIELKNGDRLTGTITQLDARSLVIKTEFAGTVTIAREAVSRIVAEQPLYTTLKDNQVVVGTVTTEGESLAVQTENAGVVRFPKESVQSIRNKELQTAHLAEIERLRNPRLGDLWTGAADVGLSMSQGNAETTSFNVGVNAARATTRDKVTVYFTELFARNSTAGTAVTTANAKRGGGRYDVNLNDRSFAFGMSDLEFDEFQKLDLRLVLGGGFGWHVRKTEKLGFDFFGGGSMNREYFSTGLDRTSGEVLLGQEYTQKLSGRATLRERLAFLPNMSERGEFRLNFDTSAVFALNSRIGWHITLSNRYLSNPVPGAQSNDFLLTTGLRVGFGK
jgi:putative salt-induced outer membrane protein